MQLTVHRSDDHSVLVQYAWEGEEENQICQQRGVYGAQEERSKSCHITCTSHTQQFCCTQAYYRLGIALQGLERYEEAMITFAEGLAADPEQVQMLNGLIATVLKSSLRGECIIT